MTLFRLMNVCIVVFLMLTPSYSQSGRYRRRLSSQKMHFIRTAFSKELNDNSAKYSADEYKVNAGFRKGDCNLEERTEMLNLTPEVGIIYFPTCVKVTKCAGCCVGMRTCRAMSVKHTKVQVLKIKASSYSEIGDKEISEGTFISRMVSSDKECKCECTIPEGLCDMYTHSFNAMDCTCMCKNMTQEKRTCLRAHRWDESKCKCICRHPLECSTGHVFDEKTCKCVVENTYPDNLDQIRALFWDEA